MNSIVVLFAHPSLEKSHIHRAWLAAISDLEGVLVRDLYQLYPEFDVDVEAEQRVLEAHDIIVFQHPLYWYSTPALLKQYQDLVLEHGWAYGADGVALRGKRFLCAISMGGKREAYQHGGFHDITVAELLAPIRQTARLCKLEYLPPFLQHGAFVMGEDEVVESALRYRAALTSLRDGTPDLARLKESVEFTLQEGATKHKKGDSH